MGGDSDVAKQVDRVPGILRPVNGYVLIRLDDALPTPCEEAESGRGHARQLRSGFVVDVAEDLDRRFPGLELILHRGTRVAVNTERAIRACGDDSTLIVVYGFNVCAVLDLDDELSNTG